MASHHWSITSLKRAGNLSSGQNTFPKLNNSPFPWCFCALFLAHRQGRWRCWQSQRGMGGSERGVGDDATGAGRCPAPSELLALLGLGLTELWGSRILSSMTHAFGDVCNGGIRCHLALRTPCETFGVFCTAFPLLEKCRAWETLVFGQHPEETPQLPAQPTPSACMVPCRAPGYALAAVFVF